MSRQGPNNIFPYPGKSKKIYPDYFLWSANDSIPPTTDEIQKGLVPQPLVKNEYASCGGPNLMVPLLKHWTALPAISYFLTTSMHVREASRRITLPTTFRPPPRVILTDQKRELWLRDLSNPKISLRKLARTIPHGIWGGRLLDEVFRHRVPVLRALWFIRCVGTNEFRTVKRKLAQTSSLAGVEDQWMRSWTDEVLNHIELTISQFDADDKEWQAKVTYLTRLLAHLFYEELVHRQALLDWVLRGLASAPNQSLPVLLLLVGVFWEPLSHPPLVQRLVRAYVARYGLLQGVAGVSGSLNDQFVRLFRSRPEAFIMPEHWSSIVRYLTQVVSPSAVVAIAKRNQRLAVQPAPPVPPAWATSMAIARSLDTFGLPYRVRDLCHELRTRVSSTELAAAVIQWTLHRGDSKALALCVAVCRQLRSSGADLQNVLIRELLDAPAEISERAVIDLVTECYRSKLFAFEVYFRRLMGSGALYRHERSRAWHHTILSNLPFMLMPRYLQSQSRMLLRRHRHPNDREIVRPLVAAVVDRLADPTLPPLKASDLTKNQQLMFCHGVVEAATTAPLTAAQLGVAVEAVEQCVMAVYKVARFSWRTAGDAAVARLCLQLFRQHLFEFVCLGVADNLVDNVLEGLKSPLIAQLDAAELRAFLNRLRDVTSHAHTLLDGQIRILDEQESTLSPEDMPLSLEAQVLQALDRQDLPLLAHLREHDAALVQHALPKWLSQKRGDRVLLCQCIVHGCTTVAELDAALDYDDEVMFGVALVSAQRLNLQVDEIDRLFSARDDYFNATAPLRLVRIQEQYDLKDYPQLHRLLSLYSGLSLARLSNQELAELPAAHPKLVALYCAGLGFDVFAGPASVRFARLVKVCSPCTFDFCRSALSIVFAGLDAREIATVVLQAIRDGVDLAASAASLFNDVADDAKAELLAAAEHELLTPPLCAASLPSLAQLVDAVAASARPGVVSPLDVADCIAAVTKLAREPGVAVDDVLRAVSLLVKFTLIHSRDTAVHYTVSKCKVVTGLLELNHLPLVCSSAEASQLVADALYVLQSDEESATAFMSTKETAPLDGLMMYSRSSDIYTPLNVWPFDLIEDANPTIGMNDLALDLARFETYVEIKDPS